MSFSLVASAWLLGVCLAQQWQAIPELIWYFFALLIAGVLTALRWRQRHWRCFFLALVALIMAMLWVGWLAQLRLQDRLPAHEDNKVTRVEVLVSDLPTSASDGVRFTGILQDPVAPGLPRKVMVFWPSGCLQGCVNQVKPGQRWRMALRFRQPSARLNFFGMDGQSWMFQQGVRASATVRGKPLQLQETNQWQPMIWIESVRHRIRQRLHRLLGDARQAPVLVALAIGDQQGVAREDWEVFNLTGITHLVSISGSHVTLIAALGAAVIAWVYRRLRWRKRLLAERLPVRLVFVWAAGIGAFFYCLLAGWGVPAQRTFFMLAAGAVGLSGRVPLTGMQAVVLAAAVMTLLDPWAVLSTGFWLSFGAMLILILLAQQATTIGRVNQSRWANVWQAFLVAAKLQWVMTLAITPVTIYLFQQLSLSGLLANAWAIPWITFVATPLALLVSALCLLPISDAYLWPLAWLAHYALHISLAPVHWLASFEWLAFETRAIGVWELGLGLTGVLLAMTMPPWRGRWLAWLLILPSITSTSLRPDDGDWTLTAFDVGQGGAVLVQTRSQAVLFDTGWRFGDIDAVERVIFGELRAMGIKHLDRVVISHPDIDHVGGLPRLEQVRSIGALYGSGLSRVDVQACRAGQSWRSDGVHFEFLHPSTNCSEQRLQGLERNRCSCVLLVQGAHHRALLTGDIDATVERDIVHRVPRPMDVVMVAHHGSRSSSDAVWINHLQATHAVIQAGQYNRFGHPHSEVVMRWQAAGTKLWVSAADGAVRFESKAAGLTVQTARQARQRYWHTPYSILEVQD